MNNYDEDPPQGIDLKLAAKIGAAAAIICLMIVGWVFLNRDKPKTNVMPLAIETSLVLDDKQIQIIPFDGCQYLYLATSKGIIFTHKGNCINRTHYNHVRDMVKSGKVPEWDYDSDSVKGVDPYDLKLNDSTKRK